MKTARRSARAAALELFRKDMNVNQAFDELTRQGINVKKSTLSVYFANRNKTATKSARKTSAKVTKMGATRNITRQIGGGTTRDAKVNFIDWLHTSSKLDRKTINALTSVVLN